MSARTAVAKRAKVIPFRTEPFIDCEFTDKRAHVEVRTGPRNDEMICRIYLEIYDAENTDGDVPENVSIGWELERARRGPDGHFEFTQREPSPHTDMLYEADEIEAFATALYRAVQLAKQRGYLPSGAAS